LGNPGVEPHNRTTKGKLKKKIGRKTPFAEKVNVLGVKGCNGEGALSRERRKGPKIEGKEKTEKISMSENVAKPFQHSWVIGKGKCLSQVGIPALGFQQDRWGSEISKAGEGGKKNL